MNVYIFQGEGGACERNDDWRGEVALSSVDEFEAKTGG